MDVLLFGFMSTIFILIYMGKREVSILLFGATMLMSVYWFKFHANDVLNINL